MSNQRDELTREQVLEEALALFSEALGNGPFWRVRHTIASGKNMPGREQYDYHQVGDETWRGLRAGVLARTDPL